MASIVTNSHDSVLTPYRERKSLGVFVTKSTVDWRHGFHRLFFAALPENNWLAWANHLQFGQQPTKLLCSSSYQLPGKAEGAEELISRS